MKWTHDEKLPNPLEKLGMGLGFFHRYADSFWKATGMELDLVYAAGEPWEGVAPRVKGDFCRELAINPASAELCRNCFLIACQIAQTQPGFHTLNCHAGQSFSVRSLGQVGGTPVLIIAGRVITTELTKTTEDVLGKALLSPRIKSPESYRGALDLIEITLPYLRIRLDVDLLLAARELPPVVRRACHYVDEHFRENIHVATVAAACDVSEDYLSHSVSKHTGNPLSRYIAAVRTGHAMYLLQEEKLGIAEIAFEVGFQSLSQFNRTFRALRGMTPSEFRCEERGETGKKADFAQ